MLDKIKKNFFYALLRDLYLNTLSDKQYFLRRHKKIFGYTPDFKNPQTFNEKIIHRILYDRNPIYTFLADKLKARIYIASKLLDPNKQENMKFLQKSGGLDHVLDQSMPIYRPINEIKDLLFETNLCEYLPKLYGIWDNVDQIDFDSLPDSFVLKTNHDSGGVIVIKNKRDFLSNSSILNQSLNKLRKHLKTNFYSLYREYHYKDIEPKVFAEELLSEELNNFIQPKDYKLHCFLDKIFIQVDFDRFTNHTRTFYDEHWNKQPFSMLYPLYKKEIDQIKHFDEMKDIAAKLAQPFKYIRVDFYSLSEGTIKIGELTFTPEGGSGLFSPTKWDNYFGEMWQ